MSSFHNLFPSNLPLLVERFTAIFWVCELQPIPRQWFVNFISKRISHKVILRVKNEERTWVVPVYFRESETGRTHPLELMCSGWKPFAADNCIKEFDACLFEPAARNHLGIPIIDVVIERHDPTMPILPPCTGITFYVTH